MSDPVKSKAFSVVIGVLIGSIIGGAALWLLATLFRPSKLPVAENAPPAPSNVAPKQSAAEPVAVATPQIEVHAGPKSSEPAAPEIAAELAADTKLAPEKVTELRNKLRKIGFAFNNLHDHTRGRGDKNISNGLSWRVQLLPYIEEKPLYERFRLNEPWDSPHNLQLLGQMPDLYRTDEDPEKTRFLVFSGDKTLFREGRPFSFRSAQDGLSKTLLVVHAGAGKAVPWTKPDDLPFDPASPLRGIGTINGRIEGTMLDASLISIPSDIAPATFAALVTPAGKELIDPNIFRLSREAIQSQSAASGQPRVGKVAEELQVFQRRVKVIGIAMHDTESTRRAFPPAADRRQIKDQLGPLFSWRIAILPWMDERELAGRYQLNEAWDSPTNRELLKYMPESFAHPGDKDVEKTRVQVFTGPGTPFEVKLEDPRPRGPQMQSLVDGTSKTIMAIATAADRAVPWTEPRDIVFDEAKPLESLGPIDPTGTPVIMFDGSVQTISADIDPNVLRSMVLKNDGK
jgi:hypothetical protein